MIKMKKQSNLVREAKYRKLKIRGNLSKNLIRIQSQFQNNNKKAHLARSPNQDFRVTTRNCKILKIKLKRGHLALAVQNRKNKCNINNKLNS